MPGGPPGQQSYTLSGALDIAGGAAQQREDLLLKEAGDDVSAVFVHEQGQLTLLRPLISTSGQTSSFDNASFHGLNAAVLADSGGRIRLLGGRIDSSGRGANGLFAAGRGSRIEARELIVRARGENAHALMCAKGGELEGDQLDLETEAERSAPIATDRGGGTVRLRGGRALSKGRMSPGVYSTGRIEIARMEIQAQDAEAVVVEGSNSVLVKDCRLQGARNGVMLYQSFSGDAQGQQGRFEMRGGLLAVRSGAVFYVSNCQADVLLAGGVEIVAASGLLLEAKADRWGRPGRNGGHARLVAQGQQLSGELRCDEFSSASLTLSLGSVLRGRSQGRVTLQLDSSSRWELSGDSVLAGLILPPGAAGLAQIDSRGYSLRYDASHAANAWLSGRSLALAGGGKLQPL